MALNSDPLPTQPAPFTPLPAPPTRPRRAANAPALSVWPIIFGVGGMLLAAGGILSGLIGLAMPLIERSMYRPPGVPVTSVFGPSTPGFVAYYICCMVFASVLAMASYQLLKRRPSATAWTVTWAIIKILQAPFAVYFTLEFLKNSQTGSQSMYYSPNAKPSPQVLAAISQATMWFTGVITAIWCLSFPIFVLCWFSRSKIRKEVASWANLPVTPTPPPQA